MTTTTDIYISSNHMMLIMSALRDLVEKHHNTSDEFAILADGLRHGGQMAFWAEGEDGAVAADRMKDEFACLADSTKDLIALLEDYEFDQMSLSPLYRD